MISQEELRLKQENFEAIRLKYLKELEKLEKKREKFLQLFPIEKIGDISLERYALQKEKEISKNSFCYWLENELKNLGNIHGATSRKFGIYYGRTKKDPECEWRVAKKFGTDREYMEAFKKIRSLIISLLDSTKQGDTISMVENQLSNMLKGKILSTYYPNKFLNIFDVNHLEHFLNKLELEYSKESNEFEKRELLLKFKNEDEIMQNWSNYEFSKFLYHEFERPIRKEVLQIKNAEEEKVTHELTRVNPIDRLNYIEKELNKLQSPDLAPIKETSKIIKSIKRNARLYQLLKEKHNYKCQICSFTFKKKDGSLYCEVCHIDSLASSRIDSEENILILCPNCHKKLDLGNENTRNEVLKIENKPL